MKRGQETVWDEERLDQPHMQADKSLRVRRMFDAIAPTYELINSVFSLGFDRSWRKKAVRLSKMSDGEAVLDVACGTGDFLRAFKLWGCNPGLLVGADFSAGMLQLAAERSTDDLHWCQADGQRLPYRDESFDIASCAFGVRNLQDLHTGLKEFHRVLRSGGRAVILEFTRPANRVFRMLYEIYSTRIMPIGATLLSRDRTGAYRYLPKSVVSFASAEEMCKTLREVGFVEAKATPLTGGIVTVYVATKRKA